MCSELIWKRVNDAIAGKLQRDMKIEGQMKEES